jgi:F0F1-type ATP synthase alpha subunit
LIKQSADKYISDHLFVQTIKTLLHEISNDILPTGKLYKHLTQLNETVSEVGDSTKKSIETLTNCVQILNQKINNDLSYSYRDQNMQLHQVDNKFLNQQIVTTALELSEALN